MSKVRTSRPLHSAHSGALLRLRRLVEDRQSFVLCFLTYSDSVYRETVAGFLAELLDAQLRVAIDCKVRVGTEELFGRLSVPTYAGPVQLSGLESWPDGLDDLLADTAELPREAFAARCDLLVELGDVQALSDTPRKQLNERGSRATANRWRI